MAPSQQPAPDHWHPPSTHLRFQDGLWRADLVSPVSYPQLGNEACFQVENGSYWFQHRMDCLLGVVRQFPPAGMFYDIGGGSGFVALALQSAGMDVVLVEPGTGARNATRRGVRHVIQATMEDAQFEPHVLPAAGAFDVIEHIADAPFFLRKLREKLVPGARFYCTVPAGPALWSEEDVYAGHFRRYNRRTLCHDLEEAGFIVEFVTHIFTWLTLPVFLFRALPSRLHLMSHAARGTPRTLQADHRLPPAISGLAERIHAWERERLAARRPLPLGTSLLCVARANHF